MNPRSNAEESRGDHAWSDVINANAGAADRDKPNPYMAGVGNGHRRADAPLSLAHYQLRLGSFEGPLDVLLRLIERSQLDITDISLVQVTSQFLDFVKELGDAPPETLADFAAVGSRMTVLKSRSLLPKPSFQEDDEPASDLTRELVEYKQLKEMADRLHARAKEDLTSFTPPPQGAIARPNGQERPIKLGQYDPSVLLRAIKRRLAATPKPARLVQARRVVSLAEMTTRILSRCTSTATTTYQEAVEGCQTRSEFSTAFLAVLVLMRRRAINAEQRELFGPISLTQGVNHIAIDPEFHPNRELAS